MNFDSHSLSAIFEKSLIRLTADFVSDKDPKSAVSELSKALNTKVSSGEPSAYNFQLKRTEDGTYHLTTSFLLYRDSRLTIINLLKWIERNGETRRTDNLFIDLKFIDEQKGPFKGTLFSTATKIEGIDKLKFILSFDEKKVYEEFPSRKDGFNSQSILRFEPKQKFIPREAQSVDPKVYDIPSTGSCGVNFETLNFGFLRMQYLGGENYEKKVEAILSILNQFCATAWDCTINKGFTKENLTTFEKAISVNKKIRDAYYDYAIFKQNFPKVKFSIDLVYDDKVIDPFYQRLRDRIYDIFSNIEFDGDVELNYDTTLAVFQLREATIKIAKTLSSLEFIKCKIAYGSFSKCDFFDCEIRNASLNQCNLFLHTHASKCNIFECFLNRTVEADNCEIDGMNGVLNGKMICGVFKTGKVGLFAEISPETTVIQYQPLKTGYMVVGDQIIIPTKKFRQL